MRDIYILGKCKSSSPIPIDILELYSSAIDRDAYILHIYEKITYLMIYI